MSCAGDQTAPDAGAAPDPYGGPHGGGGQGFPGESGSRNGDQGTDDWGGERDLGGDNWGGDDFDDGAGDAAPEDSGAQKQCITWP